MGGMNPNLLVTMMRDRANEVNARNKTAIEGRNSDTQAANAQRQAFQDLENRVDHAGTPEQRANTLLSRIPGNDTAATLDWMRKNPDEAQYVENQIDSDLSDASGSSWFNPWATTGGSAYGAGVRNLNFDEGPNDFDIGRPGAAVQNNIDAKGWLGLSRRLPGAYYSTANVQRLRRFHDALAQIGAQNALNGS